MSKSNREIWIDAAKGMLIFLVVAGHAFGTASHLGSDVASNLMIERVYKVIYFFHMPAFFFLAGVTWSDGHNGFAAYAFKKIHRLLVPYFVFGGFSLIIEFLLLRTVSWNKFLIGDGCAVNGPLWFLPCMFICEIFFFGLRMLCRKGICDIVVLVVLLAVGFYLNHLRCNWLPVWAMRAPVLLAFILLGQYFPRARWSGFATQMWTTVIVCAIPLVAFSILGWFLPWEAECHGVFVFLGYRALALLGTLVCLVFAQALPAQFLVHLGRTSLGILVLHKFPLSALQLKVPLFAQLSVDVSILLTLILSIVVTVGGWWMTMMIRCIMPALLGEAKDRRCESSAIEAKKIS